MRSILNCLFHRNDAPPFDIEKCVGKYLLEMPRCPVSVAVAGARYGNKHYSGEIRVNALGLLPWAEHHATAVCSLPGEIQAARLALPLWLRGADPKDSSTAYPLSPFISVLEPYTEDFIEMGIAEVTCFECGGAVCDVTRNMLNERSAGEAWRWWTDDWRCERGHLIYREDHQLYCHLRKSSDLSES